ncbi:MULTISPECIES: amino acid ABC transporter permease [Mesorhizobium]|uniref:Amino acid ABC transporter permease n=1 Tax=Rhizobium loti TaxID=381 RepID=A0A6M7TTL8_RHILI|nr:MULTISPECIES: amino acid ABC transporter permease [Mesorhizobium]KRB25776.1 amino acid ABC transporter permease [Mesorhizobium sp. Root172]OBQ65039.1 amino acid ABC transporter permease [Mesorhizobium loti]QKC68152.1 amino acid ABC transporter permease [Mesorhizobium loti]QKC87465.1 amino acid ABC transporter permease [Mesorhizobium sp. NZP2234]
MSLSDALDLRTWRSSTTLRTLKVGLFGTPLNSVITVVTVALLAWIIPPLLRWGIFDATWTGTSADCAAASGACWAFVGAKFRFILFAFYPPALQWRPLIVMVLLLGLLVVTAQPRFWRKGLLAAWCVVIAASWMLMSGSLVPPTVPSNQWGGLAVTLFVWSVCFGLATPLAILLALARRSGMGGLRMLAIVFIEVMRGTPMVAILYVAMLILPMAIPNGQMIDKNVRAMIMITLFWSAYVAEVIRGGLQAIPPGQYEAATALGLGYWRTMRLVVLPQALRLVIPGMVNLAIGFLLATSLLAVIGIFDLLNAARASATDPQWLGYYDEAYLLAALIYFLLCFGGSRYSLWLEKYMRRSQRH